PALSSPLDWSFSRGLQSRSLVPSSSAPSASASSWACSSGGDTIDRANEPNSPSRNKIGHLRVAPVYLLAPATRRSRNAPPPLARNARPASTRLRSSAAGIAGHRHFRRLLAAPAAAQARQETKVAALHRRRRRTAHVSGAPRFRNCRYQSQRHFLRA